MKYEELLIKADLEKINVDEKHRFKSDIKGLYVDGNIAISDKIKLESERSCILAEEIGHHLTTTGNIVDQSDCWNRKQELKAREWAYSYLISLDKIIEIYIAGCINKYEAATYLNVTEDFWNQAIEYYRKKYGTHVVFNNYIIYFSPSIGILKLI